MNKSKFLKRSLAALLAILMVATMIPSAFAATTEPDVIKVQGVAVEFSGDSATVNITAPNGTASVIENALKNVEFELRSKNGTAVGILDKNGSQKDVDLKGWPDAPGTKQTINLLSYAVKPEGTYWGDYTGIKLHVIPKTGDPVDYPLTVNVSERSASSNTGIDKIESTRIVDARIEGREITIVKPVGADSEQDTLGLKKENFKLSGAGATVDFTYDKTETNVISKVTVTAEDKSTRTYDVHYEVEPIFDSFTLKDVEVIDYAEVEDGIGTNEYSGTGKKIITVKVPYNTLGTKNIIPTFTTSEKVIQMISIPTDSPTTTNNLSFSHGDGTLYKRDEGTTSGVAVWIPTSPANTAEANAATNKLGTKFLFDVETNVSSLKNDTGTYDAKGYVQVVFMPVKNTEAKLTGVNVGDKNGANTYSQGIVNIDSTNASVIVGEIPNENLKDVDDKDAGVDVVELTRRDIELNVSYNAKVTILNPNGLLADETSIYNDADTTTADGVTYKTVGADEGTAGAPNVKSTGSSAVSHDGKIVLNNVNLRKYHSTPMRILVTSEDGSANTEYRINFNGTPEGEKPEVKKVYLYGKAGTDVAGTVVESTQDKKGNIILHLPAKSAVTGATNLADKYDLVTVEASDGATVVAWGGISGGTGTTRDSHNNTIINEGTSVGAALNYAGQSNVDGYYPGLKDIYDDAVFYGELHAVYDESIAGVACGDPTADGFKESITPFFIYVDGPATTANITEITLTEEEELYKVANNDSAKITGVINHNNNTIRLNVPYSFNRDKDGNTITTGTPLYLYDWEFNGENVANATLTAPGNPIEKYLYDLADLDDQTDATGTAPNVTHGARSQVVTLKESEIVSLANVNKGIPGKASDNRNVIRVWSESDVADSKANGTQEYTVYAVRANASDESKLNSVGATAPVSVALDTKVEKLNRFIITVPENYDSAEGVNSAPEFELSFADRSAHSTVKNGQTTWVGRDENTAKFKVVGGKLYFKNQPANLTDGRVIHFTVVAEDGTSTGAYEFEIRTTEPNDDATVSSVMVDATLSFTQDGDKFVVENLEDSELYDETKLPIIVNTTDPAATVTVDGKEYKFEWGVGSNITVDLSEGKTVPMVVTAADGKTTATYTLSMASKGTTPPDERPSDKYTDIPNDVMGESIRKAIDEGIMVGTSATKFSPNMTVSRWQFALLIARADLRIKNSAITNADEADAELLRQYSGTPKFTDARKEPLYNAAIEYCSENGIVSGKGDNKFDPNGNVNRLEAARMISDWTGITDATKTENVNGVKDWNKVNWGKEYVNAVYGAGFITGYPNGNFGPKDNLKRSQAAVIIMKAYEYMTNK